MRKDVENGNIMLFLIKKIIAYLATVTGIFNTYLYTQTHTHTHTDFSRHEEEHI